MTSKVIVITGASGGIGAELARHLGRAGHSLVLAARRANELKKVATGIAGNTAVVVADVTIRADVERIFADALDAFGRVDVWINNAGRGISRPVLDLTDEDVDEMMRVNVKSALYGIQVAVPHFIGRGSGHLINISSFLGRVPLVSHRSAYNAAKAALNALTANLRVDLAKQKDIHVSLVMPGIVLTEFAANALGHQGGAPAWASPAGARPAGSMKPQTAEEVASAIADLIEHPSPELYTNPASHELATRYYADVAAFERSQRGES